MIFIINYSEATANSTNSILVLSVVLIVEISVVILKGFDKKLLVPKSDVDRQTS